MNKTTAASRSAAAVPTLARSAVKSVSRSPLSAKPGSGSNSNPICKSSYLNLRAFANPGKCAQGPSCRSLCSGSAAHPCQQRAQAWCQQRRQGPFFGRFHSSGEDPAALGICPDTIEENRLADSSKSIEDEAARSGTRPDAIERDGGTLDQIIAAGQLRRRDAGSRCKRIAAWVHL